MSAGLVRQPWWSMLILCGWLVTCVSRADEWTVTPEISVEESLTDNVRLVERDRHSDLISVLSPGLSLNRSGRRLELQANYRLQGIFYRHNTADNRTVNLLNADGSAELLSDHLFVDAGAASSERNLGNSGAIALDNTSIVGNRTRITTWHISPYWRQTFNDIAEAELRFEKNAVRSTTTADSDSQSYTLELAGGRRFNRLLWDSRFANESITTSSAQTTRFRNAGATLQYLLTEKFSVKSSAGYDDDDYANNERDTRGSHWLLGAVYKPSVRTSFEAAVGERYFGRDVLIELSHRHRRFRWQLSYNRQPDTPRTLLLEQPVFPLTDAFGEPIADPLLQSQSLQDVILPVQTVEVFIRSRLEAAINYSFRKNSLDVSVFSEERDSQLSGQISRVDGTQLNLSRQLDSRTHAQLTVMASNDKTAVGRDRDIRVISAGLNRSLLSDLQADLTWRYSDVKSAVPGASYQQNSITASLRKQF